MFCCAAFVLAVVGQEFWRGVRARRDDDSERAAAGRARAPRAPQPAPLRRLHRARRHGGAVRRGRRVLDLPGTTATCACHPGRRRGSAATTSSTSPTARCRSRRRGRADRARRGSSSVRKRRRPRRATAHRARLLPVDGAVRLGRAGARALRGRGDEGGRAEGRPAARRLDRRPARPGVPQHGDRRRGGPDGRQARRPAGARGERADRRVYAARRLPGASSACSSRRW